MLTLPFIRDNHELIIDRLKIKNFDAHQLIKDVLEADKDRRTSQFELDTKQSELKSVSKQIGILFKEGKKDEAENAREKSSYLKKDMSRLSEILEISRKKLEDLLVQIPNLPHESVPHGTGEADNKQVRDGGQAVTLSNESLPHWDLAVKYNLIDFELGNKITGSGFPLYKGKGAKLQRALINFFLDENEKAGYHEFLPPLIVNEKSAFATGQLPDKEGQMYHIPSENYYLIPTAEVPVTNVYRDVILNDDRLPVKNTAYTPCFRREAGSYGKDVRGLNRVHQFDKVEIVQIRHPEQSYHALDEMVHHVEYLIQQLQLPYRIMQLCGGDISFTSALTYDFEVFAAAQEKWLEVSSISNFESYQANRLKLRIRDKKSKKTMLAHTLNGSALALPRIVAAILENNQTPDGILIPEVLRKYTGFEKIS